MNSTWQKFLDGLKLVLMVVLAVHVILFIILNISAVVDTRLSLIYKSYDRPNFLLVMLLTSVISILGFSLFRASYKAIRRMSDKSTRASVVRHEREIAEMKAKAAMLQTKPAGGEGVTVQVDKLGTDE
jgi:hypothetical protein